MIIEQVFAIDGIGNLAYKMTKDFAVGVFKPPLGNQPKSTENIFITILAKKNDGNDMPIIVRTVTV